MRQSLLNRLFPPPSDLTVKLDKKTKTAKVSAPEDQLSMAIGKDGQNVRLTAKLTGYRIEVEGNGTVSAPVEPKVEKVEEPVVKKITKTKAKKLAKKAKTEEPKEEKVEETEEPVAVIPVMKESADAEAVADKEKKSE